MGKTAIYAFLLGAGILLGLLFGFAIENHLERINPKEPQRDTIWERDTIFKDKPVPVPEYIKVTDSIPYPVYGPVPGDTIRDTDTLLVYLPRTQLKYEDEDYAAWVSGIQPNLDSINIYRQKEIITVTKTKKARWSLGIQSGVGYTAGGFQPYIGVGISYNLLSF